MRNHGITQLIEEAYIMLKITLSNSLKTNDVINQSARAIAKIPKYSSLLEKDILELISLYEIREGFLAPEPIEITPPNTENKWLYTKKPQIEHSFFTRYKNYLIKDESFNDNMVARLEADSEKILSFCSNPDSINENKIERKKGLVVGDVQSGKTSSYLGLIATACDYGYKVIVLLSGLTDNLRIQTQKRVDKAFIGARSSTIGGNPEYLGVGLYSKDIYAIPLTNEDSDFGKSSQNVMNFSFANFSKPTILVVKKNKSVLTSLKDWLKPGQNHIDDKILIIDDEADNASLNIKKSSINNDPSAINGLIRDIYNNFKIASYVGYTATPFANIFINPNDDASYRDLFPSDFIIQLFAPENYFGAVKVFSYENETIPKPIRILNPNEEYFLPETHKNDHPFSKLPHSLKEAVLSFLINNAIRTLRGDTKKHRSMLVNISRFNDIQQTVHFEIKKYVEELVMIFEQTHYQGDELFTRNTEVKLLKNIYLQSSFYESISNQYTWDQVKKTINSELKMIRIELMNSRLIKENRFDYDSIPEGARVIVVGGFILSRGLTLEGLSVSYFSRSANAYDTMLQMCRWFGYRPNYEDLCRVYITNENLENFRAVLSAVEDLKQQFYEMHLNNKSPDDFGLMIKQSPETLETTMLITARQKMRDGQELIKYLNYGGVSVDTSKLFFSKDVINNNIENTKVFLDLLDKKNYIKDNFYTDVGNDVISNFLDKLKFPLENKKFAKDSLVDYIKNTDIFTNWNVVIASGEGEKSNFLTSKINYRNTIRKFEVKKNESFVRISGNKNRIMDPGIFRTGLSDDQLSKVREITKARVEKYKAKGIIKSDTPTASDYLSINDISPLLVIYSIQLNKPSQGGENNQNGENIDNLFQEHFYDENKDLIFLGVALGFPNKEGKSLVKYMANIRKINELYVDLDEEE